MPTKSNVGVFITHHSSTARLKLMEHALSEARNDYDSIFVLYKSATQKYKILDRSIVAELTQEEFVKYINEVASGYNDNRENLLVVCDANLGQGGTAYVTDTLNNLLHEINPARVFLFSGTETCWVDAQNYLKGRSTNGYSRNSGLTYGFAGNFPDVQREIKKNLHDIGNVTKLSEEDTTKNDMSLDRGDMVIEDLENRDYSAASATSNMHDSVRVRSFSNNVESLTSLFPNDLIIQNDESLEQENMVTKSLEGQDFAVAPTTSNTPESVDNEHPVEIELTSKLSFKRSPFLRQKVQQNLLSEESLCDTKEVRRKPEAQRDRTTIKEKPQPKSNQNGLVGMAQRFFCITPKAKQNAPHPSLEIHSMLIVGNQAS